MKLIRIIVRLSATLPGAVGALLLGGCAGGGTQSMFGAASDQASRISGLWWFYLAVLAGVFTFVIAAIGAVVAIHWRAQEINTGAVAVAPHNAGRERQLSTLLTGMVLVTVVILFVLLFADFFTGRAVSSPAPADALTISITGNQWWWEIRYEDPDPSRSVSTANELRIPVGRPVRFKLQSNDVIHSFWVPNLHGKKDLIPGHPTTTWFVARNAGTFRGQCAEFCGYQHALMRLTITAEPADKFAAWLEAQRKAAPEPVTAQQRLGRQVFLGGTCVMCHAIEGTPARATVGPNLTHLASRERLAAGALPNSRGWLAGWILNPQGLKPGVHMPQHSFAPGEFNALLDYLETLK